MQVATGPGDMETLSRTANSEVVTTDGLRSHLAAMKKLNIAERKEVGRCANNRAENSHQPFRRRERAMLRFRRMKTLQQFASTHAVFHNHLVQITTLSHPGPVTEGCELVATRVRTLAPRWRQVAVGLIVPLYSFFDSNGATAHY
jgi:hypothetical protein